MTLPEAGPRSFLAIAACLSLGGIPATAGVAHAAAPVARMTAAAPAAAGGAAAAEDRLQQGRLLRTAIFLGDYHPAGTAALSVVPATRWTLAAQGSDHPGLPRRAAGSGSAIAMARSAGAAADADAATAILRRARGEAERRNVTTALVAYDSAAHAAPWLHDWIQLFAASAASSVGDTAEVRRRLASAGPELSAWAWRTQVRALRIAGERRGAIAAAERFARDLDTPARRASAWAYSAQLRMERGDSAGARQAWIRAIATDEGSAAALEAARALAALPGGHTDRLLAGRVFLRHNMIPRGVEQINAFLAVAPAGSPAAERAAYDAGEAAFREGDHARAEAALLALAARAGDPAVAARALFTAARAQFRAGRTDQAVATLREVVSRYPAGEATAQAAFLAADLLHDRGDVHTAARYYRSAVRAAPRSADAAAAWMRLGGMAYAAGRFEDALQEFQAFRAEHHVGRARQQADFWAGMAASATGRDDVARMHFLDARDSDPFSYHGGLAAEQLGEEMWAQWLESAPPRVDGHRALARGTMLRADALRAAGWPDAASFELDRARRSFAHVDGALYELAEQFLERGAISTAVSIAREIQRHEGAWNERLLRIVYPLPFGDIILAEALSRSIDPFLAAALIRQESLFSPGARSPVGATGLMQVMPATGRALARQLGVSRFNADMLASPGLNVAFGTEYLANQLRAYGDRTDLVLAAYNAGPGRVARWQHMPEFNHRLLFAERIPFEETRDYVRIVQNNRRIYAALYSSHYALGAGYHTARLAASAAASTSSSIPTD
jgi:soluble lytic murein transglycosylase